jgi:pseudouridylate synthase / pseudouridine kinase
MTNGVLFGVPIPASYAGVGKELQEAVERAVKESQENGVDKRGKEVTPWLLERVRELTSEKSLASSKCASYISPRVNEWPRLDRYCID